MRRRFGTLAIAAVVVVVALAGGAPLAAQPGGAIAVRPVSYLQPGDMIRVHLWQDPEMSGEFVVDESGYVSLPLVGYRQVTGRPAETVKRQLVEEYGRQLRNQTAQITMLHRVRVLGAVGQPGLYFADATMSLGDLVAEAGGVAPEGDEGDVRIQRAGRVYRTRLDRGFGEVPIQSGDVIFVDRQSWLERNASVVIGALVSAVTIVVTRR